MSISQRNSSNISFYTRHGRRASLLIHPVGLELLNAYINLKENGTARDVVDLDLTAKLAGSLAKVVREKETKILENIVEVIRQNWCHSIHDYSLVGGENEEAVVGVLSQSDTTGKPDGVVRMHVEHITGIEETPNKVQLIIEVSVDKNGGEKKAGQAFDYASLIKDPNMTTMILFTFHVDRFPSENADKRSTLKITQEAFLYLHNDEESERKMGFLWREVYEQREESKESELDFLKKSCEGIVRCLECTVRNRDAATIFSDDDTSRWKLASDNVAIFEERNGQKIVYKIFDSRFHPTHRKPDEWLKTHRSWIAELGVQKKLEFKESSNVDPLGWPAQNTKKRGHNMDTSKFKSHTAYPKGTVLVIKYNYVDGTHYASKVSHFRDIALSLSEMHSNNTVHGDVRGFNMLHPHPSCGTGISRSQLIDFDLCGEPDKDLYPPGYAVTVKDNVFDRSGRANELMQKTHDWKDLGSVMGNYDVHDKHGQEKREAWIDLWKQCYSKSLEDQEVIQLFHDFINKHEDCEIKMPEGLRLKMEQIALN